jgi:hypothetical protein
MVLLLHGAAGGLDELIIAAVALVVLWVAVKLAGRKPASDDQGDEIAFGEGVAEAEEGQQDPARPSATKLG